MEKTPTEPLEFYPPTLSFAALDYLSEWAEALEDTGTSAKLSAWLRSFVSMERTRRAREGTGDPMDVTFPELQLTTWTRLEGAEALAATFSVYVTLPRDAAVSKLIEALHMTLLAFELASAMPRRGAADL